MFNIIHLYIKYCIYIFENISSYLEINLLYENNIECSEFNDLCCKSLVGKVIERHSDDGRLFYAISEEE